MKKTIFTLAALALAFVACTPGDEKEDSIYGKLSYGGYDYRTLEVNGNTWMVDPLHFVPDGATISENPAEGNIFYPVKLTDYEITEEITYFKKADQDSVKNVKHKASTATVTVLKDDASINAQGLLYSWEMVLGVALSDVYATNAALEGVQGICPDGWHVPTVADWNTLIGEDGAYYNEAYKAGNLTLMNQAGFLYTPSGTILASKYNAGVIDKHNSLYYPNDPVETTLDPSYTTTQTAKCKYYQRLTPVESIWKGYPSMNYIASSTASEPASGKPCTQMNCAMTTFTCPAFLYHELDVTATNQSYPQGRLNIAKANFADGAVSVRCVKDKK